MAQPVVERDIGPPNAATPLQLLRTWTALPMADLASLLGVSRRTLYEWQRGSEARDENRVRLDRLIDLVGPLAAVIGSGATRTFLRDQLQSGATSTGLPTKRLNCEGAQSGLFSAPEPLRPCTWSPMRRSQATRCACSWRAGQRLVSRSPRVGGSLTN